jgi:hypothetical protein
LNIKFFISLFFISFCLNATAQIKVGQNPNTINPNSVLEVEASNRGILLPRLNLTATTNFAPLTSFVQGMFVYNKAIANDVTEGIYYSDGTKWIKISAAATTTTNTAWNIDGNTGTIPGTNFLGTLDNTDLVIKTNALEKIRITKDGWMGIGTSTPIAALQVKGQVVIDSIQSGTLGIDSFLVVSPINGRVKKVSSLGFIAGVKKTLTVVVTATGQTAFNTPFTITDANKISLYRNGVFIDFTVTGLNTINAEIACIVGDEIRIVQLL